MESIHIYLWCGGFFLLIYLPAKPVQSHFFFLLIYVKCILWKFNGFYILFSQKATGKNSLAFRKYSTKVSVMFRR